METRVITKEVVETVEETIYIIESGDKLKYGNWVFQEINGNLYARCTEEIYETKGVYELSKTSNGWVGVCGDNGKKFEYDIHQTTQPVELTI